MFRTVNDEFLFSNFRTMRIQTKSLIAVFCIAFVMLPAAFAEEPQYNKFGRGEVKFIKQNLSIKVEVATTKIQLAIGLMFREFLDHDRGMLFVFEQEAIQKVWMKNTLIPLDILFISEQGEIVSILKDIQPCRRDPCEIYDSAVPAKNMLEINAGKIDQERIKIGDKILSFYK